MLTPTPQLETVQRHSSEQGEPVINNDDPEVEDEVKNNEMVSNLKNTAGFQEILQDSAKENNEKDDI